MRISRNWSRSAVLLTLMALIGAACSSKTKAPAASKPTITNSMILLSNVHPNPPDAGGVPRPCFQYQMNVPAVMMVQGAPFTFVLPETNIPSLIGDPSASMTAGSALARSNASL